MSNKTYLQIQEHYKDRCGYGPNYMFTTCIGERDNPKDNQVCGECFMSSFETFEKAAKDAFRGVRHLIDLSEDDFIKAVSDEKPLEIKGWVRT